MRLIKPLSRLEKIGHVMMSLVVYLRVFLADLNYLDILAKSKGSIKIFMKIIVGSQNRTKLTAVENIFKGASVYEIQAPSGVSDQPMTDLETLTGAINRAKYCQASDAGVIGIGLEGGVMELNNQLLLCNWGALVDQAGQVYIASGARIPLPDSIADALLAGQELGDIIDQYAQKENVRHDQGTIGILTNNELSRSAMFEHVVTQLKGQYTLVNRKF